MLDLLRGKWLGHPLHPALVHFPAATWPLALVLDVISLFAPDPFFPRAAGVCALAGVIGAVVAVLFGLLELLVVWHRGEIRSRLLLHAVLTGAAAGIYGVTLSLRANVGDVASTTTNVLALDLIGVGLMLLGAWFGAQLAYRYGVGGMRDQDAA